MSNVYNMFYRKLLYYKYILYIKWLILCFMILSDDPVLLQERQPLPCHTTWGPGMVQSQPSLHRQEDPYRSEGSRLNDEESCYYGTVNIESKLILVFTGL